MSDMAKPDAVAVLTRDHHKVDELFTKFDLYDDTAASNLKREVVAEISRELSLHAGVEEQVLYPVMRAALPDGDVVVTESIEEHQKVKEVLAGLERMDPDSPMYVAKVKALAVDVRAHANKEESELFPRLDAVLGQQRMSELGEAIEAARRIAPTHPHPNAPAGEPITHTVAGIVDRARDLVEEAAKVGKATIEELRERR